MHLIWVQRVDFREHSYPAWNLRRVAKKSKIRFVSCMIFCHQENFYFRFLFKKRSNWTDSTAAEPGVKQLFARFEWFKHDSQSPRSLLVSEAQKCYKFIDQSHLSSASHSDSHCQTSVSHTAHSAACTVTVWHNENVLLLPLLDYCIVVLGEGVLLKKRRGITRPVELPHVMESQVMS